MVLPIGLAIGALKSKGGKKILRGIGRGVKSLVKKQSGNSQQVSFNNPDFVASSIAQNLPDQQERKKLPEVIDDFLGRSTKSSREFKIEPQQMNMIMLGAVAIVAVMLLKK